MITIYTKDTSPKRRGAVQVELSKRNLPVFTMEIQFSKFTRENSERLEQRARLGSNLSLLLLPAVRAKPFSHWWPMSALARQVCIFDIGIFQLYKIQEKLLTNVKTSAANKIDTNVPGIA